MFYNVGELKTCMTPEEDRWCDMYKRWVGNWPHLPSELGFVVEEPAPGELKEKYNARPQAQEVDAKRFTNKLGLSCRRPSPENKTDDLIVQFSLVHPVTRARTDIFLGGRSPARDIPFSISGLDELPGNLETLVTREQAQWAATHGALVPSHVAYRNGKLCPMRLRQVTLAPVSLGVFARFGYVKLVAKVTQDPRLRVIIVFGN